MYQLAVARFRFSPDFLPTEYATIEQARAAGEEQWRGELRMCLTDGAIPPRFAPHWTGDLYVVEKADGYRYRSSQEVRDTAVYSFAGRNWRTAFTDAEIDAWEAAKEAA